MIKRSAAAAAAAVTIATALQMPGMSPAVAQSVPFQDEYSNGSMALCGRNGQPVTSGSILTQPFVWKAVSSSPAPKGYTRAYLTLFQPLQHVDPSDWTGYAMTDVSIFSNPAHPVAQSTNLDAPLLDPDRQMPPYWDGLYELRMFFTSPRTPSFNSAYPTAVIKVSGSKWSLVSGGGVPCSSGQAVSIASETASPAALATPQTIKVGPPDSGTKGKTSPTTGSTSHTSSSTVAPTRTTSSSQESASALGSPGRSSGSSGGGSSPVGLVAAIAAGALTLVGAGLAVLGLRLRRRRSAVS